MARGPDGNSDKPEPFDILLFGATGDLAMSKLMRGIYRRVSAGQIPEGSKVFALARSNLTREQYLERVRESFRTVLPANEFSQQQWDAFARVIDYLPVDATVREHFDALARALAGREGNVRVVFLSLAPKLFTAACANLAAAGIVTPKTRVVLEKPLGQDRRSSDEINRLVGSIFSENQIFRIDHYLGKEAVQNLLALRFGNLLFEPLWRRGRISHVQITVGEQVGVEERGEFYDQTGALRDMVQSHLLQLLCIIAMEPPVSGDADCVRDEKLKVLRALRPIEGADVEVKTVRGQYRAGASGGKPVRGYLEEDGVPRDSRTETFVALKAEVDNWRWAGVPFYLRTGKRMPERIAEIVVSFEKVPHPIFDGERAHRPNRLIIRLQPDESITLCILAKTPGELMRLKTVDLGLHFADTFKERSLDAYERLITDVAKGNLRLFMRRDELDAAWAWIDPIREGWLQSDEPPKPYIAGTWGPAASSALISRDGFTWHGEV
ncbi:MAG: glucose-6-phosphate dehydrogenase [Steroidobacteraceae bacterium]|nr:glucose-6-phosphate dehydrogenase [Steroidobacteraceae bacterium]